MGRSSLREFFAPLLMTAGAVMGWGETVPAQEVRPRIEITRVKTEKKFHSAITHHPVVNGWKKASSESFHLIHDLENAVAEKILRKSEAFRERIQQKWMHPDDNKVPWPDRCSIYLYPSALKEQYAKETGVPVTNRGTSKVSIPVHGRVPFREICLYGDPGNIDDVLAHEVGHATTAGLLRNSTPTPSWVNEGIAVLGEQNDAPMHTRALAAIQRDARFSLHEVLTTKQYPAQRDRHWAFYVQSAQFTEYLWHFDPPSSSTPNPFDKGTQYPLASLDRRQQEKRRRTLVNFVRDGANDKIGYEAAAKKHYGTTLEQLEESEEQWRLERSRRQEVIPVPRR